MELFKNIFFNTDKIIEGAKVKISYIGSLSQSTSKDIYIHYGYGKNWNNVEEIKTEKTELGFQSEITIPYGYETLNFCYRNEAGQWDNNNGNNYIFNIEPYTEQSINEIALEANPNFDFETISQTNTESINVEENIEINDYSVEASSPSNTEIVDDIAQTYVQESEELANYNIEASIPSNTEVESSDVQPYVQENDETVNYNVEASVPSNTEVEDSDVQPYVQENDETVNSNVEASVPSNTEVENSDVQPYVQENDETINYNVETSVPSNTEVENSDVQPYVQENDETINYNIETSVPSNTEVENSDVQPYVQENDETTIPSNTEAQNDDDKSFVSSNYSSINQGNYSVEATDEIDDFDLDPITYDIESRNDTNYIFSTSPNSLNSSTNIGNYYSTIEGDSKYANDYSVYDVSKINTSNINSTTNNSEYYSSIDTIIPIATPEENSKHAYNTDSNYLAVSKEGDLYINKGLKRTYLLGKKIKLAIYKILKYIPKIISGNCKRKIKE